MANSKFYDNQNYSYPQYWRGREYEHLSEEHAIKNLLNGQKFQHGIDVGGGYGRLTKLIAGYCQRADLIEPSDEQRLVGADFLKKVKNVSIKSGTIEQIPLEDQSVDLGLVVRVLHHIPNPEKAIVELARVMKPDGKLVIEVANSTHFKARLASWLRGSAIPLEPVSKAIDATVPFVNHHPKIIAKLLEKNGFTVERKLSVSNLRLPGLKKILPKSLMLSLEKLLQRPLGRSNFGPSLIFLAKKNNYIPNNSISG